MLDGKHCYNIISSTYKLITLSDFISTQCQNYRKCRVKHDLIMKNVKFTSKKKQRETKPKSLYIYHQANSHL